MLQMNLVMEDKISLDELQEEIQELEDYVQSTDVAGECLLPYICLRLDLALTPQPCRSCKIPISFGL
jgi:hypothetical protein